MKYQMGVECLWSEKRIGGVPRSAQILCRFLSVLLGFHSSMEFPRKARGSRSLSLGLGSLMELRRFLAAQLVILSHTVLKLMISLGS
uniref:Uncharacterized protein n=1 Tax=Fagus sylvatica TaxID=28930 RepID=A0A2N9HV04_FAGSY